MFYWFVERAENDSVRRFQDEQHKHSFSAYFRRHYNSIVRYGVVIVDFMLTLENGDVIRWHKYTRKLNGQKVVKCEVKKRTIDYIFAREKAPTLKIHCLQSALTGALVRKGFTLIPEDGNRVSFDDLRGEFV